MKNTFTLVLVSLLAATVAFGQSAELPPAGDQWWSTDTGKVFVAWMVSWRDYQEWVATKQPECHTTTMDGLPSCPRPKMKSIECLTIFPPDQVGGFCDWYGYSTLKQEDRFERKRGYERVRHEDGTGDTWRRR